MNEDNFRMQQTSMNAGVNTKTIGSIIINELKVPYLDMMRTVIDTSEKQVRDSLIKLGWTPPKEDKPEPERKCGLTDEEWQVVIDGGYLCGFSSEVTIDVTLHSLSTVKEGSTQPFRYEYGDDGDHGTSFWSFCRPLRAVGHEQPYFDNDECKNYIAKLKADVSILHHNKDADYWHAEIPSGKCGVDWVGVDKFIVLSGRGK